MIKMAINLLYRLKRIFQGESGVVERVESAPGMDHLGERVSLLTQPYLELKDSFKGRIPLDYEVYKPGDKFP